VGTIRTRVTAATLALATVAFTLAVVLVAAPAQAGWTNASGPTRFHVCRTATPSGQGWLFRARAKKRAQTEDARAGMLVHHRGQARQRWASGWLEDGEAERGTVRTPRSRRVRLHVWQEAGDLDSPVGTALQAVVYRPRQIEHC
jgi:hypothetical protein